MLSFTTWGGSAACADRLCIAMARPMAVENAVAATIRFMVGSSLLLRLEARRIFDSSFQVGDWLRLRARPRASLRKIGASGRHADVFLSSRRNRLNSPCGGPALRRTEAQSASHAVKGRHREPTLPS